MTKFVINLTNYALILIFGLSSLTEMTWASGKTKPSRVSKKRCGPDLNDDKDSAFDPEKVLKSHGIDPKKIKLKANLNYKFVNTGSYFDALTWGIRVYYKNKEAGFIVLGKALNDTPRVWVADVVLKPKLGRQKIQGTGLGALMHLMAAKFAYDHFGMTLQISDETYSPELMLWENFKKRDLLEPNGVPVLRAEILSGSALNQVRDFFNSHVENDPTPFEDEFLDGYRLP